MGTDRHTARDRRLANFLIAPNRQLRIALFATAVGLFFFFGFFGFQMWICTSLVASLSPLIPDNSNLGSMVLESLHWMWVVFLILAVGFTVVLTAVTVVVSHRIYGPAFAIRKHLAAVTRGDYAYRTHLRKQDEFKDLARDLNQLSELLESKQERPL